MTPFSTYLLLLTSLFRLNCTVVSFALNAKVLKTTKNELIGLPQRRQRLEALSSASQFDQASDLPYGVGMDQNAMMEQDELVAVDGNDNVIPNSEIQKMLLGSKDRQSEPLQFLSKKLAHTFDTTQPRGIAHRAFSVFLFNHDNKLLLTKRASTKITFPGVWTNSCCSHPLYNQQPNEVDDAMRDYPSYPGIKHAAIRKLRHELGIAAKDVPHEDFVFLKKFHYWAADTVTYGVENPRYGEHEVDYVLFIRCPNEFKIEPNLEEVAECRYVSSGELQQMFQDPNLLWSPWFQGIMQRGGFTWWEQLDEICRTNSPQVNAHATNEVEFFDPPGQYYAIFNLQHHDKNTGVLSPQGANEKGGKWR